MRRVIDLECWIKLQRIFKWQISTLWYDVKGGIFRKTNLGINDIKRNFLTFREHIFEKFGKNSSNYLIPITSTLLAITLCYIHTASGNANFSHSFGIRHKDFDFYYYHFPHK